MAAGEVTQGRRLPDGYHYRDSEPGDYWKQLHAARGEGKPDGQRGVDWEWNIRDPGGRLGALGLHDITEHEDGTISVKPSILRDADDPRPASEILDTEIGTVGAIVPAPGAEGWHGFLERGVWREV